MRQLIDLVGEADQANDLGHLALNHVEPLTLHLECIRDIFVDRARRQQFEVLEDAANVAAQLGHLRSFEGAKRLATHLDVAVRRIDFLQQQLDEGRLARARRADEEDPLALVDLQRDVIQPDNVARVDHGAVLQQDHRLIARGKRAAKLAGLARQFGKRLSTTAATLVCLAL